MFCLPEVTDLAPFQRATGWAIVEVAWGRFLLWDSATGYSLPITQLDR